MSQPVATNGYKLHQDAARIVLSGCVVDLEHERVLRQDEALGLTTREARLLRYLWERQGQDVSRGALLVEVWGYSRRARSRAVDATVQRLRTKIERDPTTPDHLLTVWGSGYRLVGPDPGVAAPAADGVPADSLSARGDLLRVLDNLERVIGSAARVAVRLLRGRAPD